MADRTILDLYRHDVEAPRPDHYTHWYPGGKRCLSTEEFFHRTAALAQAFHEELGVGKGDRVMLLSDNRPEWHITDLAVLDLGAVDVPIYGTLTPEQIAYQISDSGAVAAVVESREQMAKLLQIRDKCPSLRHLIQIEAEHDDGVLSFEELIERHDQRSAGEAFWKRAEAVNENDLMTIIYTSGTTGEPKGVMLTHRNLVQNVLSAAPRITLHREDVALEFLPLCHVLERMISYILMWRATYKAYCSVYHVADVIAEIRPHGFTGVPRFYEKIYQAVMSKVALASPLRRSLFSWALGVGRRASVLRIAGKQLSGLAAVRFRIADRLVLSKIRDRLGGRVRFCISGGAELPLYVNEFFHSIGICVMEGYGLTETSPVIAVNGEGPGMLRLGAVGKPLEDVEIKLAEDGELLVKGPNVMQGYWNKEEATAEVFDDDGFFLTGDLAELDDDGFLLIVDRKKDIIVTAGGKNVAPQPIENRLKRSPFIDVAVLIGDRRPFISALITPELEKLQAWAAGQGITGDDPAELLQQPQVRQLFAEAVDDTNAGLARFEQIKEFRVLPEVLSVESGHLTPSMKVKRRVLEQDFATSIEEMYGGEGA